MNRQCVKKTGETTFEKNGVACSIYYARLGYRTEIAVYDSTTFRCLYLDLPYPGIFDCTEIAESYQAFNAAGLEDFTPKWYEPRSKAWYATFRYEGITYAVAFDGPLLAEGTTVYMLYLG